MRKQLDENIINKLSEVGNRLRVIRKARGYSNYDKFAYENDISRSQYGRYENGSDMHLSTLFKLLDAHGITINEFFSEGFEDNTEE